MSKRNVDPRLIERFIGGVDDKIADNKQKFDEDEETSDVELILVELQKIKRSVASLKREVRGIIQEEFDSLMEGAQLITEGDAETLHVKIGTHLFQGKVRLVKT